MLAMMLWEGVLETECLRRLWVGDHQCLFTWGNIFGLSTLAFLECDYRGCRGITEGVPLWSVCRRVREGVPGLGQNPQLLAPFQVLGPTGEPILLLSVILSIGITPFRFAGQDAATPLGATETRTTSGSHCAKSVTWTVKQVFILQNILNLYAQ